MEASPFEVAACLLGEVEALAEEDAEPGEDRAGKCDCENPRRGVQ